MARTWVAPAGGAGGHPWKMYGEGCYEDPRGVLLAVEQLVLAAGESVRRLRHVQWVLRSLNEDWADEEALREMAAQLEEVRGRLTGLRDQARRTGGTTPGGTGALRADCTD